MWCVVVYSLRPRIRPRTSIDPADSTPFLQAALSSGATHVYIENAPHEHQAAWITRPLFVPENSSNLHVILRAGVQLLAKRGEYHGQHNR
jgi:hypothetical protein